MIQIIGDTSILEALSSDVFFGNVSSESLKIDRSGKSDGTGDAVVRAVIVSHAPVYEAGIPSHVAGIVRVRLVHGGGKQFGLVVYEWRVVGERTHRVTSVRRRRVDSCRWGTVSKKLSQQFFDSVESAVVVGRIVGFQIECLRKYVLAINRSAVQQSLTLH